MLVYSVQRYKQTSEKYQACLNIFQSECRKSSSLLKDTNKRARMLCKRMGENVFSHAMSAAKLRIKQISSLLDFFATTEPLGLQRSAARRPKENLRGLLQSDDAKASFATPMRKHWLRRRKVYLPRGVLLAAIAFRFTKGCGLPPKE